MPTNYIWKSDSFLTKEKGENYGIFKIFIFEVLLGCFYKQVSDKCLLANCIFRDVMTDDAHLYILSSISNVQASAVLVNGKISFPYQFSRRSGRQNSKGRWELSLLIVLLASVGLWSKVGRVWPSYIQLHQVLKDFKESMDKPLG